MYTQSLIYTQMFIAVLLVRAPRKKTSIKPLNSWAGKQVMAHHGTLLSTITEWTTDTHGSAEVQNKNTEWKKPDLPRTQKSILWFHLYKTLEMRKPGDEGHICYLEYSDDSVGPFMGQNIKLHTLSMCVYCMCTTPQENYQKWIKTPRLLLILSRNFVSMIYGFLFSWNTCKISRDS